MTLSELVVIGMLNKFLNKWIDPQKYKKNENGQVSNHLANVVLINLDWKSKGSNYFKEIA